MYTVEFDKDGVSIVVIDDSGRQGDLQLDISKDDTVHLRQFQEDLGSYAVITLRFKQLMEVLASTQAGEGSWTTDQDLTSQQIYIEGRGKIE